MGEGRKAGIILN